MTSKGATPRLWRGLKKALFVAALMLSLLIGGLILLLKSEAGMERLRRLATSLVTSHLQGHLTIGSMRMDLMPLALDLQDLSLSFGDCDPLIKLESLRLQLGVAPLLAGKVRIDQVEIHSPTIVLRLAKGRLACLPSIPPSPTQTPSPLKLPDIQVQQLLIANATLLVQRDGAPLLSLHGLRIEGGHKGRGIHRLMVSLDHGVVNHEGLEKDIELFELVASLSTQEIYLDELRLRAQGLTLDAKAQLKDLASPEISSHLAITADLADLGRLVPSLSPTSGQAGLDVTLALRQGQLTASGTVSLQDTRLQEFLIRRLHLPLSLDHHILTIHQGVVAPGEGQVILDGTVSLLPPLQVDVLVTLDHVGFHDLLADLGVHPDPHVDFLTTGKVTLLGPILGGFKLEGTTDLLVQAFQVSSQGLREKNPPIVFSFPQSTVRGDIIIDDKAVTLGQTKVALGKSVILSDTKLCFDNTMDITYKTSFFQLEELDPIAHLDFQGTTRFQGTIGGPMDEPTLLAQVEADHLSIEGIYGEHVKGVVYYHGIELAFRDMLLGQKDHGARLNGSLHFERDLMMSFQVDLQHLPVDSLFRALRLDPSLDRLVQGDLTGQATLSGPVHRLDGSANIASSHLLLLGEAFGPVKAQAKMRSSSLEMAKATLTKGQGFLEVEGGIARTGALWAKAQAHRMGLETFKALKEKGLRGQLGLEASLKGTLSSPQGQATVSLEGLHIQDRSLGRAQLEASLKGKTLALKAEMLGETTKGEMDIHLGDWSYQAWAEADNLAFHRLFLQEEGSALRSSLTGRLEAQGHLNRLARSQGRVILPRLALGTEANRISNVDPIVLRLDKGRVMVDTLKLEGLRSSMTLSGWMTTKGQLNLSLRGRAVPDLLPLFVKELERTEGEIELDAALTGTLRDPMVLGTALVKEMHIKTSFFPHGVSALSGQITFSQNKILLNRLRGEMGGGPLTVEGEIRMESFLPQSINIFTQIDEAHLRFPASLPSVVRGSLRLSGPTTALSLKGDLELLRVRYSENLRLQEKILQSLVFGIPQKMLNRSYNYLPSRTFEKEKELLTLDIRIHGPENIIVRNDVINAEFKADLRLVGSNLQVGMLGEVTGLRGKVKFRRNEFTLVNALVQFRDRYDYQNPSLDVRAEAEVGEHAVVITVLGDLNDFKVQMTSSPPLNRDDIAYLLTFGITRTDLEELSQGDMGPLGYEVLGNIVGLNETMEKYFPLFDNFNITTGYSEVTNTMVPQLQVSKRLLNNLTVSGSSNLTDNQDIKAQVRWKLKEDLSVSGEYVNESNSSMGNIGVDLKWKFKF